MVNILSIPASDLVEIADDNTDIPVRIELAYALQDNLLFGERIYRKDAKLWLHKSLARIVEEAAQLAAANDMRLVLYDGLRTTTTQARMLETEAVKKNPHWLEEPRLLSPPGAGAHPRGMAIDVSLETPGGELLAMGTPFDFLAQDPSPKGNPAHREYAHPEGIMQNRKMLDSIMLKAAETFNTPLLPLPQEWWDFRLPPDIYEQYEPLSDDDLPFEMRCCD